MPDTAPAVQSMLLDRAEASALESARLSPVGASPVRFGHAWSMIGKIRATRADRGGATAAFKTALSALTASTAPSETREASRLLLELAEAQGDVELAADTAARLVEAAAAAISARSRAEDRISEHRGRKTTDFRFAANALVRANRLDEAVAALELGRTRELGLLTLDERIDLDLLAHLDPGLRDDVQEVRTSFRADILGLEERSASDRSERFTRIRDALQRTPTFEKALDPPTLEEVGKVAQPQRPLVYLGSAPSGSFAIILDSDSKGGVELSAIHVPDCDSQAIAHLAFGLDGDGNRVASNPYLIAQALEPDLLDAAIAALSALIGEKTTSPSRRLVGWSRRVQCHAGPCGTPRADAAPCYCLERCSRESADIDRRLRCDVRPIGPTPTRLHATRFSARCRSGSLRRNRQPATTPETAEGCGTRDRVGAEIRARRQHAGAEGRGGHEGTCAGGPAVGDPRPFRLPWRRATLRPAVLCRPLALR